MGLSLLSLSASTIEQLAKVRLDEPIAGYSRHAPRKTSVFWILRELGHPGLSAAAWQARHSVLKPTLGNVALLGDAEWCRVMVEGGADVKSSRRLVMAALLPKYRRSVPVESGAAQVRATSNNGEAGARVVEDRGAGGSTSS